MTTLLIPCAGLGTRLGQPGRAKALTPVGSSSLLGLILDKLSDLFEEIVIVSSKIHEKDFLEFLELRIERPKTRVVIQGDPVGSLNAVVIGGKACIEGCIVVWGDQVGVSRSTVECLLDGRSAGYSVMVPRIYTENPYVWLTFSSFSGELLSIGRLRDGDSVESGWADLGVFYFSKGALTNLGAFENTLKDSLRGREIDLTYALPLLSKESRAHFPIRSEISELMAVNCQEELRLVERYFNG